LSRKPENRWSQGFDQRFAVVEVMTRYSNNPTLLDDLRHAREVALSRDQGDEPDWLGGGA